MSEEGLSQTNVMGQVGGVGNFLEYNATGLSCKLRLFRSSAKLRFQDRPSVAISNTFCMGTVLRLSYLLHVNHKLPRKRIYEMIPKN